MNLIGYLIAFALGVLAMDLARDLEQSPHEARHRATVEQIQAYAADR